MSSIPIVIISVGAPLDASPTTLAPISPTSATRSHFITTLATSEIITVVVPQSTDGTPLASIHFTTASISSSSQSATPTAAVNNNNDNMGDNSSANTQSFPIGLIAGIVTGFSILILVMGVMFGTLWRHKRIKAVGDDEATEMRGQRSAARAYYMPQPPSQQQQQQQQQLLQQKTEAGGDDESPVRGARAPPEVATPRRRSSSVDTNKPWPPMPLSTVYRASASPVRESGSNDGRATNHPDPVRADGPIAPATGIHAVPYTPSKAALQRTQPLPAQELSTSPTIEGSRTAEPDHGLRNDINYSNQQHLDAELARAGSLGHGYHFALRPPPRRKAQSDKESEAAANGEGRIGGTPGLRLSVCGAGHGEETSLAERMTWYGGGHNVGERGSVSEKTPLRSASRRFSQ